MATITQTAAVVVVADRGYGVVNTRPPMRWTPSSVSPKITSLDEALTYSLTDAAFILGGLFVITGTVKWFNPNKGFGFILPDDGTVDNFVHISAVKRAGLTTLLEGQKIEYELVEDRHGQVSADNLKLVQ